MKATRSRRSSSVNWSGSITARTIDAALFIMFYRVVQGRRRCVVHVGRVQGHRSKRWGLEGELHQWVVLELCSATAIRARRADIMETVVGESPAGVADKAGRFGVEKHEAALGLLGDRALFSLDPAVESGGPGFQRALEGGKRAGDRIDVDGRARQGGLKLCGIGRV